MYQEIRMTRIKRPSPRRLGMPLPQIEEHHVHRLPGEIRRAKARPFGIVSPPPALPDVCQLPEVRKTARTVPLRGKFSGRAHLNLPVPATSMTALFTTESFSESKTIITLVVRPDFHDLAVQVGPVAFTNADGRLSQHFIDIVFTDTAGKRTAFLVKNRRRAACPKFQDAALRIAAAAVPQYADEVQIVTDEDLDPLEVLNASRFLYYRRFPDPEADGRIQEVIASLIGPAPIVQLMRMSGLGGRAYRSVFRAIFEGTLTRCSGGEIDHWTVVKAGGVQ